MHALVVEDDNLMRDTLRTGLEETGLTVEVAAAGPQGLAKALERAFDVIVLDVLLPGLDGLSICRKLRGRHVATPVLLLSARSAVSDRVAGLDAGADDYLVKPFAFAELRARVRALTRRPPAAPEDVLTASDLELDVVRRVARRGGAELPLTATELSLLEFLLRREGRPCSARCLLEGVWGFDTPNGANLVAVHVRHLRTKLEQGGRARLVHTVRGVGYVLRAP